jgi:DNA primase
VAADAVAEIKARLDIIDVIGGYVSLQRSGREFKALCPFHAEKTPSFTVSQERQAWYCFGCQEGGDLFSFVEKIERTDFRQALELLADRAGVELESRGSGGGRGSGRERRRSLELNAKAQAYYEHVLWSTDAGASGRELLTKRGVDEQLARTYGVGFAPAGGVAGDALVRYLSSRGAGIDELVAAGLAQTQRGALRDRFRHRLLFPIRDERGAVIGFGGRALGDAMPKYLNTPDTSAYRKSQSIFGIDLARKAIEREHAAVIVEGYFDVIGAHAAGVEHVVASSGTALTREQVRILSRYASTFVLCFDADGAGRAAASRAVDVIAAEGVQARICVLPDGVKDPDEMVRRDPQAFAALVADAPLEWAVLLSGALAGGEGGSIEARRAAAERAVALLVRIPEAATRDLYLQQAASRLDVSASSLAQHVAKARRQNPARTAPVVAAAPAAEPPDVGASAAEEDTEPPPAPPEWEAHLGGIVVHRPVTASTLVTTLGLRLDDLTSPAVRRIFELAMTAGDSEFPLYRLSASDRSLAARLLVRDVPELQNDEALDRAMRDCAAKVHESTVMRSLAVIRRELQEAKEAGRDDDVRVLAARLAKLAAEAPHLRRTLAAR